MDVLAPVDGGRPPLEAVEETRVVIGVTVREPDALGGPLSCFVGDLVGDLTILDGRDAVRDTGLGLGAFKLLRFARERSPPVEARPEAGLKLLGRAGFRAAMGAGLGVGAGAWARMVAIMGLMNIP
jgi:hypothetical protein